MRSPVPVDSDAQRRLRILERLLQIPAADLRSALSHAMDLVAEATGADKVDAFLYDESRDSLVATGSNQPLSALQRQLGLDVLPISNGGRAAHVFTSGTMYVSGKVEQDDEELRGIRDRLKIRSAMGMPLSVAGRRRGVLLMVSLKPEYFTDDDARLAESVARWVGLVAHRAELVEQTSRNALEHGRRAAAEELVTVLAHDLRNLLAPIEMRLHALRLGAERNLPVDAGGIDSALKGMQRLRALVTDLLDVARIDEGLFRVVPQPVDLQALLGDISQAFATPEHEIDVRIQATGQLVVAADPARVRQCLENLLFNAVEKSPEGAPVTIIAQDEKKAGGGVVRLEVIDQGPGVPEDIRPHIFDRFVTGKRREGGLGIGLYVAKRIALLHGGDLTLESGPGQGARFALTLPAY